MADLIGDGSENNNTLAAKIKRLDNKLRSRYNHRNRNKDSWRANMTTNQLAKLIRDNGAQNIVAPDGETGIAFLDDDGDIEISWSNGMTTGADHCIHELRIA
jgi:hypothetical protein